MTNITSNLNAKGNTMRAFCLVFLALVSLHAPAAEELKVIANPSFSSNTISADELKGIYLEEKISLEGTALKPVLAKSGAAHERFLKEYLGKSDAALQTYYRSLVFTGKGSMPKVVGSDAEAVAYVARTRGAIAYVSASTSTQGVKTLTITH